MKAFRGFPAPISAARETTRWVRTEKRDALRTHLSDVGIATSLNYPKAPPFYPADTYPEIAEETLDYISKEVYPDKAEPLVLPSC